MLLLVLFFIFLTLVQAFRKPPEDINCFRIIYPSYFEKHFTVVVLDTPGDSKRVPRALFLDPLQEFREEVTSTFVSYFKQRKCDDFSTIHVHGGDQGNNMTECGIFAMMNCQILLTEQIFFSLQDWKAKSLQRNYSVTNSSSNCKHNWMPTFNSNMVCFDPRIFTNTKIMAP